MINYADDLGENAIKKKSTILDLVKGKLSTSVIRKYYAEYYAITCFCI